MSSTDTNISVKTATQVRSKEHTTPMHVTTCDFYKLKPVWFREVVPNQTIRSKMHTFCRFEPMTHPIFGRIKFVNRAFFVPIRSIFKQWNSFIEQTVALDNAQSVYVPRVVPTLPRSYWYNLFLTPGNGYSQLVTEGYYDFDIQPYQWSPTASETVVAPGSYRLTEKGRALYDLLWCLGYRFQPEAIPYNKAWFEYNDSMLPLYAYLKIWLDWYSPSEYALTVPYEAIFSNIDGRTNFNDVVSLCNEAIKVSYQKDYLTSAWNSPVGPNNNNGLTTFGTNLDIKDITVNFDRSSAVNVSRENNNTPHIISSITGGGAQTFPQNMSLYVLDALKSATDYVKRFQLSGVRAIDRYLAEFGIKLPDSTLNRSTYLGKVESMVDIGDVLQTSETATTPLGSYAGKGIGYGSGSFEPIMTKNTLGEFGYFMILSVAMPETSYYEGINRFVMHKYPLDFFHGDFDRLGAQAINLQEVQCFTNGNTDILGDNPQITPDSVFGFTSRYAEYKHDNDMLSGRMILDPEQYRSWHLFRSTKEDSFALAVSKGFLTSDQKQFNRVFADMNEKDHIQVVHQFEFDYDNPYSKLYQDYEFDESKRQEQNINIDGTRFD